MEILRGLVILSILSLEGEVKKYQIIYADPPWRYTSKSVSPNREVIRHYPTMDIEEIMDMNVKAISDKNCYLFLWVTSPNLDIGIDVLNKWGFAYKTVAFCWLKTNKDKSFFMGLGGYTRSNVELCLLGVKGKLKRLDKGVRQVIISQRKEHSKKPAEVRRRIMLLYGDLPRIELFARKPKLLFEDESYKGWDIWGNEVENDIDLLNLKSEIC